MHKSADHDAPSDHGNPSDDALDHESTATFKSSCILSVHDSSSSSNVLVNESILPSGIAIPGDLLQIRYVPSSADGRNSRDAGKLRGTSSGNYGNTYHFFAQFATSEQLQKLPNLQISIPKALADSLRMSKGSSVTLSKADEVTSRASHVELIFRDQYLARGDMWRLTNRLLAGQCIYAGQKIEFMGTIRAVIKAIFVDGAKVTSAVFHPSTKPIFRSESARYVLFIQMSREMWEFDTTGTGEIMFDKVVNGFLPELFKRWRDMQVRHLVTIVLFTRLQYDKRPLTKSADGLAKNAQQPDLDDAHSKDYYRIVATDVASIESANILERLKQEFQTFLPDVLTKAPTSADYVPLGSEGLRAASVELPVDIVSGRPTVASQGNILEAINLASSQFSSDYIDRDLIRTGVSIVVLSPGPGLFEVDYRLLIHTTENLTDNGVGIDLVCLSQMPLHSVPLFRYSQPSENDSQRGSANASFESTPTHSYSNTMSFGTPVSDVAGIKEGHKTRTSKGQWQYGIPHWVDVSYWTTIASDPTFAATARSKHPKSRAKYALFPLKEFKSRIRMYELQMMGITEDASSNISIPSLSRPSQSVSATNEDSAVSGKPAEEETLPRALSSSISRAEAIQSAMKPNRSLASSEAGISEDIENGAEIVDWMDTYDSLAFRDHRIKQSPRVRTSPVEVRPKKRSLLAASHRAQHVLGTKHLLSSSDFAQNLKVKNIASSSIPSRSGGNSSVTLSNKRSKEQPNPLARNISFGPQGLRLGTPSAAVAIASADVAVGRDMKARHGRQQSHPKGHAHGSNSFSRSDVVDRNSKLDQVTSESGDPSANMHEDTSSGMSDPDTSRPIPIRKDTGQVNRDRRRSISSDEDTQTPQDRVAILKDVRVRKFISPDGVAMKYGPDLPTLSPSTTLAPWVTVLNPCNPSKALILHGNRLGRWHHIFPRPLKASQIKWKSLCSPAAVPLTTEDFPTPDEMVDEYRERTYVIPLPAEMDTTDQPRSLTTELVAFRLSRGFQVVVGEVIASSARNGDTPSSVNIFKEDSLAWEGSIIYMSRGGTIHRLTRTKPDRLEVKVFTRHNAAIQDGAHLHYTPRIRSMLADEYEDQAILMSPQDGGFNWEYIDAFIAGYERPKAEKYVEGLRPWRARFVLIPMENPADSRRTSKSKGLTEEEIRLEGIKKLTQLWQKCRYVLPEDRQYTKTARLNDDANPLDVRYFTTNTSAIVREELDNAAGEDMHLSPVQLLPEAELHQRSGLNTKTLVETLQGPKGVRIVDRRWHWKLHHHCLIGSELTTWLLESFKDINSREEACDFGNELMKDGLFRHVEKRHDFRDGHYFYQIGDDYRVARPESRGFFGWAKAPVLQTPFKETSTQQTPLSAVESSPVEEKTKSEKRQAKASVRHGRPTVALGKSLVYNLTHSRPKTSYREELMNLHYDRLHNPDACYHIRIEWMNTTSKLIQDAVNHWAMIVEAYGLRLIEVPIGEASSIRSMHPFRAPYLINLARAPPAKLPSNYFEIEKSTEIKRSKSQFYHQAILKRFNYVLDFEAATDFPPDVDVSYSWGKPDYRYPQYIHRSGLLIAQIDDDGSFLVLANRLYNNKSASARAKPSGDLSDHQPEHSPLSHRNKPLRTGDGLTRRASPQSSPFVSPALRASLDIPSSTTPASRSRSANTTKSPTAHNSVSSASSVVDPERLTREFQDFCSNVEALDAFYAEQQSRTTTPGSTPFMQSSRTPSRGPQTPVEEGYIPDLTLPGSLNERGGCSIGREKRLPHLEAVGPGVVAQDLERWKEKLALRGVR
ncbi:uncharacterized protein KY384_007530 [Bacidia gigantensis]|uniref:uncharacterized protein n=1 Tax=Bacidia gigantensis TaxID=2732470 RepID=UPI001D047386|nr:uncharacterized protein KY384_007530 [Bacidia gigantensis]KAG8527378.1 hypothetical protein KY384_007530 [Bacidia gigantensis]